MSQFYFTFTATTVLISFLFAFQFYYMHQQKRNSKYSPENKTKYYSKSNSARQNGSYQNYFRIREFVVPCHVICLLKCFSLLVTCCHYFLACHFHSMGFTILFMQSHFTRLNNIAVLPQSRVVIQKGIWMQTCVVELCVT